MNKDSPLVSRRKKPKLPIEPLLWLLPAMAFFMVFTFYPFAQTVYKSFFILNRAGQVREFVGLENYLYILKDEKFRKAIANTLFFTLLTVPTSKILGLLLALLANKRRKLSTAYEAGFALPMAMSTSVTAMIFQLLYVPSLGVINGLFGLKVQWLNDPKIAMISIAIIQIWLSTGYAFVFLLSAVRSVPDSIIENADLEGIGPVKKITRIYLPLVSPTLFYLLITDIAYSMMMMSFVNILTEGGPKNATITIMQYVFSQLSATGNYTNANPAAIIAFILTFVVTMAGFVWEKKGVHYQ